MKGFNQRHRGLIARMSLRMLPPEQRGRKDFQAFPAWWVTEDIRLPFTPSTTEMPWRIPGEFIPVEDGRYRLPEGWSAIRVKHPDGYISMVAVLKPPYDTHVCTIVYDERFESGGWIHRGHMQANPAR